LAGGWNLFVIAVCRRTEEGNQEAVKVGKGTEKVVSVIN
jgi:hypothetical protein